MQATKRHMPYSDCDCLMCDIETLLPEKMSESQMCHMLTRIFIAYEIAPINAITTCFVAARDYEQYYLAHREDGTDDEYEGDDEDDEDDHEEDEQPEPTSNGRKH